MRVLTFLVCVLVCLAGAEIALGLEGDAELLKLVADGYDENMARLRTWGGTIETEGRNCHNRTDYEPNEIRFPERLERSLQGEFLIDRDAEITRWFNSLEDYRVLDGAEDRHSYRFAGMSQADLEYQMWNIFDDQRLERTMGILAKENGGLMRTLNDMIRSPLYTWENMISPCLQGCDMLRHVYENGQDWEGCSVVRNGDLVTYESRSNNDDPCSEVVNRFVYDVTKGCNMVEFYAYSCAINTQFCCSGVCSADPCELTSYTSETRIEADYALVDDVFVLCEMTENFTSTRDGVDRERFFHARWETSMVNEVVDPCEFGFDKIGLRIGDSVTDRRTGDMLYNWQGNSDFSGMSTEPVQRCRVGESSGGGGCGRSCQ